MSTRLAPQPAPRRRRTTRDERVVILRSSMPLQLVTLRHDIPQYVSMATPEVVVEPVEPSPEAEPAADVETAAGKGGDARW